MLKQIILCGAFAALLVGMLSIPGAQAQGFILDPNNSRKNAGSSRDAQPAYKGGVVVPYVSQDSKGAYGSQSSYRRQEQKTTQPIGYGTMRERAGQAVSPGIYGKDVGLNPEEKAQKDRMARIKAHQEKRKAENAVRAQAYREKRAAERQAMLEAEQAGEKSYGGGNTANNRKNTR